RLRRTDILGRYGGEEFIVFLPTTLFQDALSIAQDIRTAVESFPFSTESGSFSITISIGAQTYQRDKHSNLDAFIADADAALYQAKHNGKNQVVAAGQ
ncbi:diguanylate cyclase, partial [Eubacteriales bacterium OttesenSCG-928-M02]|nr:diguanylate cyclase [Eubacteriales bacterium OttesenSCG-928-M02]